MEQEIFYPAVLRLDVQQGEVQRLRGADSKGQGTIHMKTGSVRFASTRLVRGMGRGARNTARNTEATTQKEPVGTEVTLVPGAALQAPLRAGCASVLCVICKVPLPTFPDTLGLQEEKRPLAAGALVGTLALDTVAATALAEARVAVERWRALLYAGAVLEHVAVHALQAVCSQRPAAHVATPITLSARVGGDVKIVLWGAAVVPAFPKEQHLVRVSAGGTAGLRITAPTMYVAALASAAVIWIVSGEAGGAAGTNVGQNEAGVAGRAGGRSSTLAGPAGGVASLTSAPLCVVSERAVGNTVVTQQQVAGILAPQTDAPGILEIGCTVLAQGVAVHAVSHEAEELFCPAAGLAAPTAESDMRVTGGTVRFQWPEALPTGWVAFCTVPCPVEVALWALGEALPVQQHLGRPAGSTVLGALPCTP